MLVLVQPTAVALCPPKVTVVAPGVVLNPVPITMTTVPPAAGPAAGPSCVTDGNTVKGSVFVDPAMVVTLMVPSPIGIPSGTTAVQEVADMHDTLTFVCPLKF